MRLGREPGENRVEVAGRLKSVGESRWGGLGKERKDSQWRYTGGCGDERRIGGAVRGVCGCGVDEEDSEKKE